MFLIQTKKKRKKITYVPCIEYEEFNTKKRYIENAMLACIFERVRKKYFKFTWINGSHYTESVVARGYVHPFKSKVNFFPLMFINVLSSLASWFLTYKLV